MSNTGAEAGTGTAKWQREVNKRIQHKIRLLQEEFEEISFLRHVANELRGLRKKKSLPEICD